MFPRDLPLLGSGLGSAWTSDLPVPTLRWILGAPGGNGETSGGFWDPSPPPAAPVGASSRIFGVLQGRVPSPRCPSTPVLPPPGSESKSKSGLSVPHSLISWLVISPRGAGAECPKSRGPIRSLRIHPHPIAPDPSPDLPPRAPPGAGSRSPPGAAFGGDSSRFGVLNPSQDCFEEVKLGGEKWICVDLGSVLS